MMVVTAQDKKILMQTMKLLSTCVWEKMNSVEAMTLSVTLQNLDLIIKRIDNSLASIPAVTTSPNVLPIGKKKK